MPQRFELEFVGKDGATHTPVMLHRALLGSIERFVGILLEHYAGDLPLWLAPVQMIVLPISDKQNDFATQVKETLANRGFRVEADLRSEKIGYKIRHAENLKIPYMAVGGAREIEKNQVALRRDKKRDLGKVLLDPVAGRLGGGIL